MQDQVPEDIIDLTMDGFDNIHDARRALVNDPIPVGSVALWPYGTAPVGTNWILANGQTVNRVTYSALFAKYSTDFGVGDGVTTFAVPNYGSFKSEDWHVIGAASQPAFQNSWGNVAGFQVCQYRKDPDGMVTLTGSLQGGVSGNVSFNIPVGWRSIYDNYHAAVGDNGIAGNFIFVDNDGNVTGIRSGTNIFFTTVFDSGVPIVATESSYIIKAQ